MPSCLIQGHHVCDHLCVVTGHGLFVGVGGAPAPSALMAAGANETVSGAMWALTLVTQKRDRRKVARTTSSVKSSRCRCSSWNSSASPVITDSMPPICSRDRRGAVGRPFAPPGARVWRLHPRAQSGAARGPGGRGHPQQGLLPRHGHWRRRTWVGVLPSGGELTEDLGGHPALWWGAARPESRCLLSHHKGSAPPGFSKQVSAPPHR